MSDPIVEQIALTLVKRLKDISPDSGFNYAPARVLRPKREGYSPEHLLILVVQDDATLLEEIEGNPFRLVWVQPFLMGLFVKPTDDDTEPLDAIVNRFAADVVKAVCTPANWESFGSLARDAHWAAPVRFDTDDGAYAGVILQIDVTYQVAPADPFTVA